MLSLVRFFHLFDEGSEFCAGFDGIGAGRIFQLVFNSINQIRPFFRGEVRLFLKGLVGNGYPACVGVDVRCIVELGLLEMHQGLPDILLPGY